jgi:hypothetical protein
MMKKMLASSSQLLEFGGKGAKEEFYLDNLEAFYPIWLGQWGSVTSYSLIWKETRYKLSSKPAPARCAFPHRRRTHQAFESPGSFSITCISNRFEWPTAFQTHTLRRNAISEH